MSTPIASHELGQGKKDIRDFWLTRYKSIEDEGLDLDLSLGGSEESNHGYNL